MVLIQSFLACTQFKRFYLSIDKDSLGQFLQQDLKLHNHSNVGSVILYSDFDHPMDVVEKYRTKCCRKIVVHNLGLLVRVMIYFSMFELTFLNLESRRTVISTDSYIFYSKMASTAWTYSFLSVKHLQSRMDVKGITWIENIYQKFEAMCLEVEEIMYQDTVKYVEDQVETVGASVRKFYSEVMQDLDPPSSLDPVVAPEIPLEKWEAGKTYKRPTTCIKRMSAKASPNRFTKGSDVLGIVKKDGGHASSIKRLNIYRKTSSNSNRDAQLVKREDKTELRPAYKSLAAETQPQSEASATVLSSERKETHSLQVLSTNMRTIKHEDTPVNSAGVGMARDHSANESINENRQLKRSINVSSSNVPPPDVNNAVECIENDGRGTTVSSLSADSGGTSSSSVVLPVTAVSDVGGDSYFKIPDHKDSATSGNSSTGNNLISLDKPDWGNLEESCIFINADGRHSISCSSRKGKSYKKTIRNAFSSKKKVSRAREYEQLAVLYNDAASGKDCCAGSGKGGNSDSHGSSECDWELL